MPGAGTTLPLAFSQSKFAKESAPKLPPFVFNDEAKKTLATDYTNKKDRDDGMVAVTLSIMENIFKVLGIGIEEVQTSSSVYNQQVLDFYDIVMYDWNVPMLWRGDVDELKDLYRTCVGPSKKHCEFAVGTGLMLDHMVKEGYLNLKGEGADKLLLIDLAPDTLDKAVARLGATTGTELTVEKKIYDVVEGKEHVDGEQKDLTPEHYISLAANMLLHCLHEIDDGDSVEKAVGNISKFVHPTEGVFFGSSVLGKDILDDDAASTASKFGVELINKYGVMDNLKHDFERIAKALKAHFDEVEVWQTGHCAVWMARKPKSY